MAEWRSLCDCWKGGRKEGGREERERGSEERRDWTENDDLNLNVDKNPSARSGETRQK